MGVTQSVKGCEFAVCVAQACVCCPVTGARLVELWANALERYSQREGHGQAEIKGQTSVV